MCYYYYYYILEPHIAPSKVTQIAVNRKVMQTCRYYCNSVNTSSSTKDPFNVAYCVSGRYRFNFGSVRKIADGCENIDSLGCVTVLKALGRIGDYFYYQLTVSERIRDVSMEKKEQSTEMWDGGGM